MQQGMPVGANAKKTCGDSTVPLTSAVCSTSWSTLAHCLEYLIYDQVGTTVPDGLWKGLHVGCSNPIAVPGCLVKVETFSTATRCDAAMLHHW